MLRCAPLPRFDVQPEYACARPMIAGLASELFEHSSKTLLKRPAGSRNALAASTNEIPCLSRLLLALRGSQSNIDYVYTICALCTSSFLLWKIVVSTVRPIQRVTRAIWGRVVAGCCSNPPSESREQKIVP